jgi:hypothetical protein
MGGFVEIERGKLGSKDFLRLMKKFREFRIKFRCDNPEPFRYFYAKISKKELEWHVRMDKVVVSYEIRYDSKVDKSYKDIVYILKMRSTILDTD